jgi:hypothetical protein
MSDLRASRCVLAFSFILALTGCDLSQNEKAREAAIQEQIQKKKEQVEKFNKNPKSGQAPPK